MSQHPTVFACDMSAIAPADRATHTETIASLFQSVLQIDELDDGYSFHLPHDDNRLTLAVAFVARERLCCPFFDFTLRVDNAGQRRTLDITGPSGVKPFIIAELGGHINPSLSFPGHEVQKG